MFFQLESGLNPQLPEEVKNFFSDNPVFMVFNKPAEGLVSFIGRSKKQILKAKVFSIKTIYNNESKVHYARFNFNEQESLSIHVVPRYLTEEEVQEIFLS